MFYAISTARLSDQSEILSPWASRICPSDPPTTSWFCMTASLFGSLSNWRADHPLTINSSRAKFCEKTQYFGHEKGVECIAVGGSFPAYMQRRWRSEKMEYQRSSCDANTA